MKNPEQYPWAMHQCLAVCLTDLDKWHNCWTADNETDAVRFARRARAFAKSSIIPAGWRLMIRHDPAARQAVQFRLVLALNTIIKDLC